MLFELSHHSDHHLVASKKYQTFKLPSGYIGVMLLSFIQPVWFWIENPLLERINCSEK